MRTKVTLVLLFLNVALFFFIFNFQRDWSMEREQQQASIRVLGPDSANIQALSLTGPALEQEISLERRNDTWHLVRPVAWPANANAVSSILVELTQLERKAHFSVKELQERGLSLREYGLDQPRLTVAYTSSGGTQTALRIGSNTPDGRDLYTLSPDGGTVNVVSLSVIATLTQPLANLHDPTIFTIPEYEARTLSLQQPTGTGSIRTTRVDRQGDVWNMTSPILARANRLATRQAINDLNNLRVRAFIPNPPANAFPAEREFGLKLYLGGNGRNEAVDLGNPAAAPGPAETLYYARKAAVSREPTPAQVFTVPVPNSLLEMATNAQVALRERRILPDLLSQNVTAVTIGAPDPILYLQRLEGAAPGGDARGSWRISLRAPGGEAEVQPADAATVQNLLDRLVALSAADFVSNTPQEADLANWGLSRPSRRITLSLAPASPGASATQVELRIGRDEQNFYARRADLEYVYRITDDLIALLPTDRNAWRERVLRTLPPSDAINTLTVTDRRSNSVVASFNAPATGAAPAASTPMAALVEQLRVLRARDFIAEPFNPAAAQYSGRRDPWRYQIDLSTTSGGAPRPLAPIVLTDRIGGQDQVGGSAEFGMWHLDQALIDALDRVLDAPRDPGPPPDPVPATPVPASPATSAN